MHIHKRSYWVVFLELQRLSHAKYFLLYTELLERQYPGAYSIVECYKNAFHVLELYPLPLAVYCYTSFYLMLKDQFLTLFYDTSNGHTFYLIQFEKLAPLHNFLKGPQETDCAWLLVQATFENPSRLDWLKSILFQTLMFP